VQRGYMLLGVESSGGRLPSELSRWWWWWSERSGRASGRVQGARGKVTEVVEWNVSCRVVDARENRAQDESDRYASREGVFGWV
jgi:hypothetical protein